MTRVMLAIWIGIASPNPARAIENLNCEFELNAPYAIVPGSHTRLGRDEVVIRGHLEANLRVSPSPRLDYAVRDAEGYDRIFPATSDSLHRLEPGDRIFLTRGGRQLFLHGYYGERPRPTVLQVGGEMREFTIPRPQIFEDPERRVPRLGADRFAEMFEEAHEAVVIKRLDPEIRDALRARLNPQIELYRAHQNDPARFVRIAPNREPYEMRSFEAKIDGRLVEDYPNFPILNRRHLYSLSLSVIRSSTPVPIRSGDRLFVLDKNDLLLKEFLVGEYPVSVRMPNLATDVRELLDALGDEARTILIRQVGRTGGR